MTRWENIIFNICLFFNVLLLFLAIFGTDLQIPTLLQVFGRMHPLALHFPIVLLLLVVIWECIVRLKIPDLKSKIGDFLLLFTTFTTSLSALMGLFLAQEEGYETESIIWHQWGGVLVSILTLLWFSYRDIFRKNNQILYSFGALSLVSILFTGHQGANITHGQNFLFAPLIPENKPIQVLLEDAIVYSHLIKPILEEKCIQCHNTAKSKGDLNMETIESLLKGGKNGKLWDTTATQLGLMMQRVHLPLEEKKHMPPKGKLQLTEDEIKILYYWIRKGSNFKIKVVDLEAQDSLKLLTQKIFKPLENEQYNFAPISQATLKKLNNDYRIVYPIALKSPALAVDFFGMSNFKNSQLSDLQAIKENVIRLNLQKMPVQDSDLKEIAKLKNLRKLNLAFTKITGANLGELKKLKELKSLSLSGTSITAQNLNALRGMEKLASVYVWNTQITEKDLTVLKKQFPRTHFEIGFKGESVSIQLNPPIIETEKQIFKDKLIVKLKHYLKGVKLRYTLDGKEPDSLQSAIYKEGINIEKTTELKVKAFLKGWKSSELVSRKYFKSAIQADSIQLLTQANEKYRALGAKSLQDQEKGDFNFKNGLWLGYHGTVYEIMVYFKQIKKISSVGISTLISTNAHIFPPAQIEVWGGDDEKNLKLLNTISPEQPNESKTFLMNYESNVKPQFVKILKLRLKPISALPTWHDSKGKPAWIMIDEILLN